jgi:hypothetical protein
VQIVTDACTELVGAQFGAFFYNVINDKGESYMLYALAGVPRESFDKFPMPRNTAVFEPTFKGAASSARIFSRTRGMARTTRTTVCPRDTCRCAAISRCRWPPVLEVIGGLFFGHGELGQFGEEHEEL